MNLCHSASGLGWLPALIFGLGVHLGFGADKTVDVPAKVEELTVADANNKPLRDLSVRCFRPGEDFTQAKEYRTDSQGVVHVQIRQSAERLGIDGSGIHLRMRMATLEWPLRIVLPSAVMSYGGEKPPQVRVVNSEGNPVEGVVVRLALDSVRPETIKKQFTDGKGELVLDTWPGGLGLYIDTQDYSLYLKHSHISFPLGISIPTKTIKVDQTKLMR